MMIRLQLPSRPCATVPDEYGLVVGLCVEEGLEAPCRGVGAGVEGRGGVTQGPARGDGQRGPDGGGREEERRVGQRGGQHAQTHLVLRQVDVRGPVMDAQRGS